MMTISFCIVLAVSQAGQAQVSIQLPIVNVQSVATSVWVPDGGRTTIGAMRSSTQAQGPVAAGQLGGGSRGRENTAGTFDSSVRIIDLAEYEDETSLGVASKLFQRGRVHDAITKLNELKEKAKTPLYAAAAKASLANLRAIGLEKLLAAHQLAQAGDKIDAADQVDQVMRDYALVLDDSQALKLHLQLKQDPEVMEHRHGAEAADHLQRAREYAKAQKVELARIHYRLAANRKGTTAGKLALTELAALPANPRNAQLSAKPNLNQQPANAPGQPSQVGSGGALIGSEIGQGNVMPNSGPAVGNLAANAGQGQQNVGPNAVAKYHQLARLYRTHDVEKSQSYYRKAMIAAEPGSELFDQLVWEATTVFQPANAKTAPARR